jgi:uncharacterized protein YwgA
MSLDFMDVVLLDLRTLFDVKETVNGKVDLQKSLYFAKELGLSVPFNFRWSKIGPYSYELANVIDRLVNQGYLEYRGNYVLVGRSLSRIQVNYSANLGTFFDTLNDLCREKKYNEVYFIECAASLHFIYNYSNIRKKDAAFRTLKELKPERIGCLEPYMEDAWDFLVKQGMIK